MNSVQIGHKSYEMRRQDGVTVAYFLNVGDVAGLRRPSRDRLESWPHRLVPPEALKELLGGPKAA